MSQLDSLTIHKLLSIIHHLVSRNKLLTNASFLVFRVHFLSSITSFKAIETLKSELLRPPNPPPQTPSSFSSILHLPSQQILIHQMSSQGQLFGWSSLSKIRQLSLSHCCCIFTDDDGSRQKSHSDRGVHLEKTNPTPNRQSTLTQ